jgi:RHS repeat-associated protein
VIIVRKIERQTFIGKEQDYESSLGDFGVRKYDDFTGRFFQIDPLWEKYYGWTPYQYSVNNPVSFLDPGGLLPGDKFTTERMAAHDFGKNYNPISFLSNREIVSNIYLVSNPNGADYYTYAIPTMAGEAGCNSQILSTIEKDGYKKVAAAHTHGPYDHKTSEYEKINPNNFSKGRPDGTGDLGEKTIFRLWLVTPGGMLKVYDPSNNTIGTTNWDMPFDTKVKGDNKMYIHNNPEKRPFPIRLWDSYWIIRNANTRNPIETNLPTE